VLISSVCLQAPVVASRAARPSPEADAWTLPSGEETTILPKRCGLECLFPGPGSGILEPSCLIIRS